MRKEYDFTAARKNPYASQLKKQTTIRLDEESIDYFKSMNRDDFESAVSAVRERVGVLESDYSEQSFGSWNITVSTGPVRRLVWDGKESWLIVQKQISLVTTGPPSWEDSWVKRGASSQNLAEAVERLFQ